MSKAQEKVISIEKPKIQFATISIEGDTDLCLNKMNYGNKRDLPQFSKGKVKKPHNYYGDLITAIHWKESVDEAKIYEEATKEMLEELLKYNKPCISGFGMKKACCAAVVRNNINGHATKFDNTVNVIDDLIPIEFATHSVRELITSPRKGSPVVSYLNQFSGWNATFTIQFIETAYTLESIVNIIDLAGFGGGVGSGKTSGFGRFHIVGIEE